VSTLFEEQLTAGSYKADWNASQMPSGIYIYRIVSGSFTESRKMIMVK
ncbi:MAG: subtilisin-like serine protease, partial [Chlorobi bacterium OLB5]